jgi:hypothetical protein
MITTNMDIDSLKVVKVKTGVDIANAVEEFTNDKIPRLIKRGNDDLALITNPQDYHSDVITRNMKNKAKFMSLSGRWKHLDTDTMKETIKRAREQAPISEHYLL